MVAHRGGMRGCSGGVHGCSELVTSKVFGISDLTNTFLRRQGRHVVPSFPDVLDNFQFSCSKCYCQVVGERSLRQK